MEERVISLAVISRARAFHWGPRHNPEAEISDAEQTDAQIDALAAMKGLKPEVVAAMREGKAMIGMVLFVKSITSVITPLFPLGQIFHFVKLD